MFETDGGSAATRAALELLAPAGDGSALRSALEAGADAVYLGMRGLNARRRARNFGREEFARAVAEAHAHGAKAYLTLNIDVAEGELATAAKMLWWAEAAGVDAVLVRDPGLLALGAALPAAEFHLSTQAGATNSADVRAARELGCRRVVLAREMTLAEIQAASAVPGVQTEVFVQGALCFSVSGRCYLSSWAGGRSGNRGICTSPCRVPWKTEGEPAGWPFSMRDLTAVHRLDELGRAGPAAVKIEGRMKNAAWVRRAVQLYRRALDGEATAALLEEAAELGRYTGRQVTWGYLDGQRRDLTGPAGREGNRAGSESASVPEDSAETEGPSYALLVEVGDRGIQCRCTWGGHSETWSIPKTVVRRRHKAVSLGQLAAWLASQPMERLPRGRIETNQPDYLLVPRAANRLAGRIAAVVGRAKKRDRQLADVELPDGLRRILEPAEPCGANRLALGDSPDRVRVEVAAVEQFRRHCPGGGMIVEGVTEGSLGRVRRAARRVPLVVALPAVFFEEEIPVIEGLLAGCRRAGVTVEVNSWGGWWLARQAGVRMEGGPGLAVLNHLAAARLAELGLRRVSLSCEADRRKLEALTTHCPVPCSVAVYGRPPLWTTRVALAEGDFQDRIWEDRRGVRIRGRRERGVWVFRPVEPFDLRDRSNPRIRAAHLVVDLSGSEDPLMDFRSTPAAGRRPFHFNYDRSLV